MKKKQMISELLEEVMSSNQYLSVAQKIVVIVSIRKQSRLI